MSDQEAPQSIPNHKSAPEFEYKRQTCGFVWLVICSFVYTLTAFLRFFISLSLFKHGFAVMALLHFVYFVSAVCMVLFYHRVSTDPNFSKNRPPIEKFWPFAVESVCLLSSIIFIYKLIGIISREFVYSTIIFFVNSTLMFMAYGVSDDDDEQDSWWLLAMKPYRRQKVVVVIVIVIVTA